MKILKIEKPEDQEALDGFRKALNNSRKHLCQAIDLSHYLMQQQKKDKLSLKNWIERLFPELKDYNYTTDFCHNQIMVDSEDETTNDEQKADS